MLETVANATLDQLALEEGQPCGPSPQASSVAQVVRHINANLNRKHTLEELAEIAGCSVWHFVRIFQRVTNLSPMTYLSASRIEAAKRLLVTSDARIIDICYDVGYNSLGSFGKRFTKLVGMSPRQVRSAALEFDARKFRSQFRIATEWLGASGGVQLALTAPEHAGDDFLVFSGLFPANVPTLMPVTCGLREGIGDVNMRLPKAGYYRVFAVAIPRCADREDIVLQDCTLRGSGGAVCITKDTDQAFLTVDLQEPHLLGPPLLPILPLMLQQKLVNRR